MNRSRRNSLVVIVGFVLALGCVKLGSLTDYTIFIFTMIFMYSCLASSLDMLVGLAGRMSFAHAAFFGIGAYSTALMMIYWKLPFLLAALLGVLATAVVALAIGVLTIRLQGMYFALATTALGVSFVTVIELHNVVATTGGASGLVGIPTESYLQTPKDFCVMFLVLLAFGLLVKIAITESRVGRRLIALRDDEELALTLGVRTNRYKVFAFVLSACLAGLTGGCFAIFFGSLAPADFDIWSSFNVIVWVLVGGAGTLLGPLLGTALLWTVPQLLNWDPNVNQIIYGVLLVAVITFRRGGLVGIYTSAANVVRTHRRNRHEADDPLSVDGPPLVANKA